MELRVLKYFLAVAREENITKAAALLHLTQPTLSRQLMQLEEELGVQLFRRSRYHIELTEDGMLLRRRAQELVDLAEKTTREFTMRETELMGEIAIGAGETRSMSFLSRAIVSFRERYPKVTFRIFSANADDVKERLQIAANFNLILNAANMVRYGVGTALSFDLNFSFDDLRFIPLSPTMDTGTVLVWKKDQVLTPAVEAFHQHIKNVQ